VALFAVTDMESARCPSTDECRKKMWSIHTMECYLAIKKNKVLPCAAAWMGLGNIL
jgi:hypothetical protein